MRSLRISSKALSPPMESRASSTMARAKAALTGLEPFMTVK
jgi:hypothetical protein